MLPLNLNPPFPSHRSVVRERGVGGKVVGRWWDGGMDAMSASRSDLLSAGGQRLRNIDEDSFKRPAASMFVSLSVYVPRSDSVFVSLYL